MAFLWGAQGRAATGIPQTNDIIPVARSPHTRENPKSFIGHREKTRVKGRKCNPERVKLQLVEMRGTRPISPIQPAASPSNPFSYIVVVVIEFVGVVFVLFGPSCYESVIAS